MKVNSFIDHPKSRPNEINTKSTPALITGIRHNEKTYTSNIHPYIEPACLPQLKQP
jgi:hypothetical protein